MQQHNIHILSTRPLEPALVEQAKKAGVLIDELSLLATEPVQDDKLEATIRELAVQPVCVAITSINAAKAVAAYVDKPVRWKIFTIGTSTRNFVSAQFGEQCIAAVAENASSLATLIIAAGIQSVVFFCGDQRRDELPQLLANGHVQVQELVVYRAAYTPRKTNKPYDGILFFSPGAVQSFFAVNPVAPSTVLFAIGTTTAANIRAQSPNPVVVSEQPAAAVLVNKMISYFTQPIIHEHKK